MKPCKRCAYLAAELECLPPQTMARKWAELHMVVHVLLDVFLESVGGAVRKALRR